MSERSDHLRYGIDQLEDWHEGIDSENDVNHGLNSHFSEESVLYHDVENDVFLVVRDDAEGKIFDNYEDAIQYLEAQEIREAPDYAVDSFGNEGFLIIYDEDNPDAWIEYEGKFGDEILR